MCENIVSICSNAKMRDYMTILILTCVNLLNYMDRFSIAGVLLKVKDFYSISDTQAGFLTTVFVLSYMLLSPVFGYMGDRWNRKLILACGIAFWSIATLSSSFIGRNGFYVFIFMRALIGVGEASYSTIAPTIIADLFADTARTKALSVYFFAIPVGSGLGYIVGSGMADLFGGWQWSLRFTPLLGLLCSLFVCIFVHEPSRGAADKSNYLETTTWLEDVKYLMKHKSFLFSTFGFTCVSFVTGALALWAPIYLYYSISVQPNDSSDVVISLAFGLITCLAGVLGVVIGSGAATFLRKMTPRADPFVCAFGMIASSPCLYFSLITSRYSTPTTFFFIFIAEIFIFLNWTLVSDMTMRLVLPTRRSTANALQILLSHALGDAGSPVLIGFISDRIKKNQIGVFIEYYSLQSSLYLMCFVCVLGGAFFLLVSLFIEKDQQDTLRVMQGYEAIQDTEVEIPT